jgi:plasmid maintenance system antidote protein VapI
MTSYFKKELKKKCITIRDIMNLFNISEETACEKMENTKNLTIDEAIKIKNTYFPDYFFDSLFKEEDK